VLGQLHDQAVAAAIAGSSSRQAAGHGRQQAWAGYPTRSMRDRSGALSSSLLPLPGSWARFSHLGSGIRHQLQCRGLLTAQRRMWIGSDFGGGLFATGREALVDGELRPLGEVAQRIEIGGRRNPGAQLQHHLVAGECLDMRTVGAGSFSTRLSAVATFSMARRTTPISALSGRSC